MVPESRRSFLKASAVALSTGLAGCSGMMSTDSTTTDSTTADSTPTESQPSTTPVPDEALQTIEITAEARTKSAVKTALLWDFESQSSANRDIVRDVIEDGSTERRTSVEPWFDSEFLISVDERYYRIERQQLGEPTPLKYKFELTRVTSCSNFTEAEKQTARTAAVPFESLSESDRDILSSWQDFLEGEGCANLELPHDYESREAVEASTFLSKDGFYFEYDGAVWQGSASPRDDAAFYIYSRYSLVSESDSLDGLELPSKMVASVDTSPLSDEEKEHLETLRSEGQVTYDGTEESTLLTQLTASGEWGPKSSTFFEVGETYYEFTATVGTKEN